MRVVVLGGTRFVGRAIVRELLGAGDDVLMVHRGRHPADGLSGARELLVDRVRLADERGALARFRPDAVVDVSALTGPEAAMASRVFDSDMKRVAISSIDAYRAYEAVWNGGVTDPVPLEESAPLRAGPPPGGGEVPEGYDPESGVTDNVAVEREWLAAGAIVCRLPMVYGERDYKRREEFVLRRLRAGRRRIPIGPAGFLWSRGYAPELARGISAAMRSAMPGAIYNLAEPACASVRLWTEEIISAAGAEAELVQVPEKLLPGDLGLTAHIAQHWVVSSARAERDLGWRHADWQPCVKKSVGWHLDHPPEAADADFAADDAALVAAG